MNIYDNVRAAADAAGKTISDVEREAGLSNGTIGKWRIFKPRVDRLLRVARVLNVDINELAEVTHDDE